MMGTLAVKGLMKYDNHHSTNEFFDSLSSHLFLPYITQPTRIRDSRPLEMKKTLGRLRIMKYCRPPWLADEESFSFQISKTARKT